MMAGNGGGGREGREAVKRKMGHGLGRRLLFGPRLNLRWGFDRFWAIGFRDWKVLCKRLLV